MVVKKTKKKTSSKVVVYSTPTCPWCAKAKEFLKEQGIKFRDVDVSKNAKSAQEMVKKSGQSGVPVIDIGGEIVVGFDLSRIKKLL